MPIAENLNSLLSFVLTVNEPREFCLILGYKCTEKLCKKCFNVSKMFSAVCAMVLLNCVVNNVQWTLEFRPA
jgi:hypothetical protein